MFLVRKFALLGSTVVALVACREILGEHTGILAIVDASTCEGGSDDPSNCGRCGHDCLGGSCNQGVCQPVTLASALDYSSALAIDDTNVYWVDYDTPSVATIGKDGTCTGTTCEVLAPTSTFTDIASPPFIVSDGTNIYFGNFSSVTLTQTVYERSANGEFIALGTSKGPFSGAWANGYLYWTNAYDQAAVMRARTGVPMSAEVVAMHAAGDGGVAGHVTNAVALDESNVYWIDSTSGEINSVAIGQTCLEDATCALLYTDAPNGPIALVVDAHSIYWSNKADSTIKTMAKTGGAVTTIATGQVQVQAMLVDGDNLYWGAFGDSTIRTMRVDGPPCDSSTCAVLATEQVFPYGMAFDESAIYWTSQRVSGTVLTKSGAVRKLAK